MTKNEKLIGETQLEKDVQTVGLLSIILKEGKKKKHNIPMENQMEKSSNTTKQG